MDYQLGKTLDRLDRKLDLALLRLAVCLQRLGVVEEEITHMAAEINDLEAQVKANTDAEQGAVTLLGGLHDLLVAAGTDPAKLKKLTADLAASKDALAAAIVVNTPSDPAAPPAPSAQAKKSGS